MKRIRNVMFLALFAAFGSQSLVFSAANNEQGQDGQMPLVRIAEGLDLTAVQDWLQQLPQLPDFIQDPEQELVEQDQGLNDEDPLVPVATGRIARVCQFTAEHKKAVTAVLAALFLIFRKNTVPVITWFASRGIDLVSYLANQGLAVGGYLLNECVFGYNPRDTLTAIDLPCWFAGSETNRFICQNLPASTSAEIMFEGLFLPAMLFVLIYQVYHRLYLPYRG
ncbi:hypothetical protein K2W90_03720 [Candidatus Babeliales bacterium]|nr:hypothetical protein [Candidatus Babeliales bacterium]